MLTPPAVPDAAGAPRLSVVVASFRDRAVLDACLTSLLPQCAADDVELIVARAAAPDALAALAADYPTVRVVAAPTGADVPRLRGAGLAAAAGDLAALTEDHCVAAPGWVAAFRRHVGTAADVVGGGMDNARDRRALDWGAFFAEYGFFGATTPRAAVAPAGTVLLTGANVAYARRVLPAVAAWAAAGAWENVVHDRLRAAGATFVFDPAARVGQNLTYSFAGFVADRYRHGHDYARVRLAEAPTNRWLRVAVAPLLPPLLAWRVARTAAGGSARRAGAFARALPFTLAFLGAWAAGEIVGYLKGPATLPAAPPAPSPASP